LAKILGSVATLILALVVFWGRTRIKNRKGAAERMRDELIGVEGSIDAVFVALNTRAGSNEDAPQAELEQMKAVHGALDQAARCGVSAEVDEALRMIGLLGGSAMAGAYQVDQAVFDRFRASRAVVTRARQRLDRLLRRTDLIWLCVEP
jgi:hypothetical protein